MTTPGPVLSHRRTGVPSTGPLVAMGGISKSFGPVEVLHGVDFQLARGEVHALAGENGAGKSTLMKILSGVYERYSGTMRVCGEEVRFTHPIDAVCAGIATIHQELSLVPSLSVSDNLFLGRETTGRLGFVDFESQEVEAQRLLADLGLSVSPSTMVEELPVSMQQLLEIGRALSLDANVFVFDEPTSALNEHEAEILFEKIHELRARGCGVVYITHRMEEIYRLADRITVLRDGEKVGTAPSPELPSGKLIRWMVGRDVAAEVADGSVSPGAPSLEVTGLTVEHKLHKGRMVVDDLSFTLFRGEILGLAGLQGSGVGEVLHGLFGALGRRATGKVKLFGKPYEICGPRESVERGVVLLTNDRKTSGLAPDLSVIQNASLACLSRFCVQFGWIRREDEADAVRRMTDEFSLNAPSLDAPVRQLSGGNQQKVYLARWLLTEPCVLLLDEPTRGVDVGAKSDIYRLMRRWVENGMSIILITSEMEELLALCDRIMVLHRGRLATELSDQQASKDTILAAAMGEMSETMLEEDA